ncbi:efflux transporter outer membrane subunit [Dechloromonas sp. XY25]|uniref:Efflux transporter outer membrane subunit n=1 Tax=Dechloromonas hankyongensis TaxID=2908002 RepID=A0ABS9K7L3_9RHOO|nr:efflux transporter outer membrane subunit [Dechloromonas hankyongensis]MCG2579164.1 efflux transporter outer membrane subunit [Dechloromonas hankyongensis]
MNSSTHAPSGLRTVYLALAGFCTTLLWGCADVSMPDYQRPDSPAKTAWSRSGQSGVSASETIVADWWKAFGDPYLDNLIERAIAGNYDIKILAARSEVASAQIDEVRAGALPTVDIGAGASFEKSTGRKSTQQFNVGTQVNWEIDIWGKVKKGVHAQTAEFNATEADWRAAYLTMVADVATTYFQILQLDEQSDQQRQTLGKNKQILATYEAMLSHGLAPETQVLQQRAEINRLTKDLLELRRSRDLAGNALATLLGVPAGEWMVPSGHLRDKVRLPVVPAGLPSQLLARRPDIVAAEFRVLQAYNLVGQAKLEQLPSISLTGHGGTASFALSSLLKSFTLGLLPSINFPLFNPGIKAHVKTTEAQIKVAEQTYGRTVIGAFEEVENALVNLEAHQKQRSELQQQTDHLQVVAAQVQAQLKEGVVSQLQVFESERSLLAAQLGLLASHQQILADTVTLYKVLGGGWSDVRVANPSE